MSNGYVPSAILFNGTTDYMHLGANLTGIVDSKVGTASVWVRIDGGDGFGRDILSSFGAFVSKFRFHMTSANKFGVNGVPSSVHINTVAVFPAGPAWIHVLASWDTAAGTLFFYIDDVSDISEIANTDAAVSYSDQDEWNIGADNNAGSKFTGAMADLYFTTEFLDLSVEANRRKFIDTDGNPVYLGDTGELPTGTAALVYLRGNLSNQGSNSGTGGDFISQDTQVPGETPGPVVPVAVPGPFPATTIGKGTTGLLSDLKDFVRLADATDTRKDTVATLKPIKVITGWSLFQGTAYSVATVTEYDFMRLDIVGVKTSIDTGLTRVETLQLCVDTPGTYFYVVDEEFGGTQVHWDDGSFWDTPAPNSPVWDQFNTLYIHLFDGTDPDLQTVVAQYGIFLSNREMIIPELGPDKLINGDFENWTPNYLTNPILFDGSTDYLLRGGNITGLVDSMLGTLSVWFRVDGENSTERYIFGNELSRFSLRLTFKNEIILRARNTLGQEIIRFTHDNNIVAGPNYHHYVASWDLGSGAFGEGTAFLDDTSQPSALISQDDIDYTDTDWIIGALNAAGDDKFTGATAEFYFTNEFIDITVEANRRKFITENKGPISLGTTGELPTGTAALVYLLGDDKALPAPDDHQGFNSGTGGDFVIQGEQVTGETLGPVVETADGWTSSDDELASKESSIVKFNDFALKHTVSAAEPTVNTKQQLTGFVVGQVYRFAGYYQSSVNAQASISVFNNDISYLSDGRNTQGSYQVEAWNFDGASRLELGSDFAGNADGKRGIASVWFKTIGDPNNQTILQSSAAGFQFRIKTDGTIRVFCSNAAAAIIMEMVSNDSYDDNVWHLVLASWDLEAGRSELYIDGVADLNLQTLVNDVIDYTKDNWIVGNNAGLALPMIGDLAQLYLNVAETLDLTIAGNRAKFITLDGFPVDLGSDGSFPTGNPPLLLLQNDHTTVLTNSGTGGDFLTEVGDVTEAATTPSPDPIALNVMAVESNKLNIGTPITESKTFFFDFRAFTTTLNFQLFTDYIGSGTAPVSVYWDAMTVERIWRFTNCDPRLSGRSVPKVQTGSNDIFFGGKSIGSGSIGVINSDGQFERLIADFEWMNQEVIIQTGGAFNDGQEIPFNDYRHAMTGLIQKIDVDDFEAKFDLQDIRAFFHQILPAPLYTETDDGSGGDFFIDMDLSKIGLSRPIFFGVKEHIDPVRIDKTVDGITDLGIYEICDTTNSPDGMKAIDKVFVYGDEIAAAFRDPARRFELGLGISYSEDLAAGTITILQDVVPILVEAGNNTFSFNDGGGIDHDVVVTPGFYSATGLGNEVSTAMEAAGGESDTICVYSATTGLWTISRPAGTLDLFFSNNTANNEVPSDFPKLIGFNLTDKTGALSYSSDEIRDVDIDRDIFFRVDAQGYKDDVSGTFTGIPDALIEIGADILRCLLVRYMNKSPSVVDESSFVAARTLSGESLALLLNSPTSTKDIFERLEFSNISNILVNGEGKVFYKVYVGEIPPKTKTLSGAEIQNFSIERSVVGIYAGIRIKYDQNPGGSGGGGRFKRRQADDDSVPVRLGRPEIREFDTYLKSGSNALSTANRMLELARTAARKVSTTAVGGKFVDLEVGDKLIINRDRALSVGGKIRNEVFRIISIGKEQQEGIVDMELTDDRVTVASDECTADCQQHCEGTCQDAAQCTISCQETCQQPTSGQEPCQVNCQDTCQRSCESCQGACQSTEETAELCSEGCETTCQACEGSGCQTSCETSGCEATCQDCQTVKQVECNSGVCQTACQQGGCEGGGCQNCQDACETGATCESGCQTGSCETTCQTTGCEGSCQNCQDSCQTGACQQKEELI